MENYCIHCGNSVKDEEELCAICWDQIPAIFTCVDCGETCYRKDGEFGSMVIPEGDEEDVEIRCAECTEISSEECLMDQEGIGQGAEDFYDDEYFEEQI